MGERRLVTAVTLLLLLLLVILVSVQGHYFKSRRGHRKHLRLGIGVHRKSHGVRNAHHRRVHHHKAALKAFHTRTGKHSKHGRKHHKAHRSKLKGKHIKHGRKHHKGHRRKPWPYHEYLTFLNIRDMPVLKKMRFTYTDGSIAELETMLNCIQRQLRKPGLAKKYRGLGHVYILFYFVKRLKEGASKMKWKNRKVPGLTVKLNSYKMKKVRKLARRLYLNRRLYLKTLKAIFPNARHRVKLPKPTPPKVTFKPINIETISWPDLTLPMIFKEKPGKEMFKIPKKIKLSMRKNILNLLFPYLKQGDNFRVSNIPDLSLLLIKVKGQPSFEIDDILYSLSKQLKLSSVTAKYPGLSLLYLLFYCIKAIQNGDPNPRLETLRLPGVNIGKFSSNFEPIKRLAKQLNTHPALYYYTLKTIFPSVQLSQDTIKWPASSELNLPQPPQNTFKPINLDIPSTPNFNLKPSDIVVPTLPDITFPQISQGKPSEETFNIPNNVKTKLNNNIINLLFPYTEGRNVNLPVSETPDLSDLLIRFNGQTSLSIDDILHSFTRQLSVPSSTTKYPGLSLLYILFYFIKALQNGDPNPSLKTLNLPGLNIRQFSSSITPIRRLAKLLYTQPTLYHYILKTIFRNVQLSTDSISRPITLNINLGPNTRSIDNMDIPSIPKLSRPGTPQNTLKPIDIKIPTLPDITFPQVINGKPGEEFNIPNDIKTTLNKNFINLLFPSMKDNFGFPVTNMPDLSLLLTKVNGQSPADIDNILSSFSHQLKIPSSTTKYPGLSLLYVLFYYIKALQTGNPNPPLETLNLPGVSIRELSSNIAPIQRLAKLIYTHPTLYHYTLKFIFPSAQLPLPNINRPISPNTNPLTTNPKPPQNIIKPINIDIPPLPNLSLPNTPQITFKPIDIKIPTLPDITFPQVINGNQVKNINIPNDIKTTLNKNFINLLFPSMKDNFGFPVTNMPDLSLLLTKVNGQSPADIDNILSSFSHQLKIPSSTTKYPGLSLLYVLFYYIKALQTGNPNPPIETLNLPGVNIRELSSNIAPIQRLAKLIYTHPTLYHYTLKFIFPSAQLPLPNINRPISPNTNPLTTNPKPPQNIIKPINIDIPPLPNLSLPNTPQITFKPIDIKIPTLPDITFPQVINGKPGEEEFNIPNDIKTTLNKNFINLLFPSMKDNFGFPVTNMPDLSLLLTRVNGQSPADIDNILSSFSHQLKIPSSTTKYPGLSLLYVLFYYIKALQTGNPNPPLETLNLPGVSIRELSSNIAPIQRLAKLIYTHPTLYHYTLKFIFPSAQLPLPNINRPISPNTNPLTTNPKPPQNIIKPINIDIPPLPNLSLPNTPQITFKPIDIKIPTLPDITFPQVINGKPGEEFNIPNDIKTTLNKNFINLLFPSMKDNFGFPVTNMPDLSLLLTRVNGQSPADIDNILSSFSHQLKIPSSTTKYPGLSLLYVLFYYIKALQTGNPNPPLETLNLPGVSIRELSSNIAPIQRLAKLIYTHPTLYHYTLKVIFPSAQLPLPNINRPISPNTDPLTTNPNPSQNIVKPINIDIPPLPNLSLPNTPQITFKPIDIKIPTLPDITFPQVINGKPGEEFNIPNDIKTTLNKNFINLLFPSMKDNFGFPVTNMPDLSLLLTKVND
ncbi:uncharacterized protein [Panulirus ornatus]|uniref:uncharacterized protein n=1 Tax=Panulirus ornatus TaxID=150431 RepID=UPI003A86F57C